VTDEPIDAAAELQPDREGRVKAAWPWLVAIVGLGLVVVATVDLTADDGGAAPVALLVAGALLLLAPLLVPRLEELTVGGSGIKLTLTHEIAHQGAPRTAGMVERSGLAAAVETYATAYDELSDPTYERARIHLQDRIVARAAATARRHKFDGGEVRTMFMRGSPTVRVLALGLMEGDPSLADVDTIESAIASSLSGNEQYHGLQLAQLVWPRLSDDDRQRLIQVIDEDRLIYRDNDRARLAHEIVGMRSSPAPTTAAASDEHPPEAAATTPPSAT
jgi:hypothetical protein